MGARPLFVWVSLSGSGHGWRSENVFIQSERTAPASRRPRPKSDRSQAPAPNIFVTPDSRRSSRYWKYPRVVSSRSAIFIGPYDSPVRVLGEVQPQFVAMLQLADDIFIEELHQHNLYDETSQAFAVFLPIKSVGVMGDRRKYDYVIALRAVETIDFMTARWARLPYDFLELVSLRIINEVDGISRVTYDISGKPPATIEWE